MKTQLERLGLGKFETKKISSEMMQTVRGGKDINTTTYTGDVASLSCSGPKGNTYDAKFTHKEGSELIIETWSGANPYPGTEAGWYD